MMRLLILSDSPYYYPPFRAGGSVRQLRALARTLRQQGLAVTVVARRADGANVDPDIVDDGAPIRYLGPAGEQRGKGWAALLPNLLYMLRVFAFMLASRHSFDVVVISGFRLLAAPAGLAARLLGKRCVLRIENANDVTFDLTAQSSANMHRWGQRAVSGAIRVLCWSAFRTADRVVAFCPDIAVRLKDIGAPARKIAQIPNGVDCAEFAPVSAERKLALRVQLALPTDSILFIFTGRLAHSKGIMSLLESWRLLAQERSNLQLLLLGSGGDSFDSCELAARGYVAAHALQDSVAFCGGVDDVAEYLQAADVFISLSEAESFGVSILEAFAVGLPSVLTPVGVAADLPPSDWGESVAVGAPAREVLAHLQRLLERRDAWTRMAMETRRIVGDDYSFDVIARAYCALLGPTVPDPT